MTYWALNKDVELLFTFTFIHVVELLGQHSKIGARFLSDWAQLCQEQFKKYPTSQTLISLLLSMCGLTFPLHKLLIKNPTFQIHL